MCSFLTYGFFVQYLPYEINPCCQVVVVVIALESMYLLPLYRYLWVNDYFSDTKPIPECILFIVEIFSYFLIIMNRAFIYSYKLCFFLRNIGIHFWIYAKSRNVNSRNICVHSFRRHCQKNFQRHDSNFTIYVQYWNINYGIKTSSPPSSTQHCQYFQCPHLSECT